MCGRYAFFDEEEIYEARKILEDIAQTFGKEASMTIKKGEIFPTETAALIVQTNKEPISRPCAWGYALSGKTGAVINARLESIFDKPLFSKSINHKKCLIPATAFYEWEIVGKIKIKRTIRMENEPLFYMCGLYATFFTNGKSEERFVIITQEANERMRAIHNRMPLIIPTDLKDAWLHETQDVKKLSSLIHSSETALHIA